MNGVTVTSFPAVHAASGAVGYRIDFAGLTFVHSGDTWAGWPLVRACEGGVDLLIHECFPPAAALAAATLPPIASEQRVTYTPALPTPPDWWADARIPLDDVEAPREALVRS